MGGASGPDSGERVSKDGGAQSEMARAGAGGYEWAEEGEP